jgi:hypothetical protein
VSLAERIKHEVGELLPPTIFFLVTFHILVLSRALMLRQYGVEISAMAGATLGALLVAKVVLLADMWPGVNRFPDKPLIYNVLWKTAIYVLGALAVHFLEHLVPMWWRDGDVLVAGRRLIDEVVWPHFWAIQLWLVVLLFVYCAFREFVRAIGRQQVRSMFLGGPIIQRT